MSKKNKNLKAIKFASNSLHSSAGDSKIRLSPRALNEGQKQIFIALSDPEIDIVFISGIAGSGKTYCSVSWGLEQFLKDKFQKLIFTRPIVEAGEQLGFLPGNFESKISPYMIPILDSLLANITDVEMKGLIESGKMLTLPLAYMRGCTFTNSFVLLDEAQNTTIKQMHLFLTRIGSGTKMVITGDPHQSDLGDHNGFNDAIKKFKHTELPRVKFIELNPEDVVRHPLISSIDDLYKKNKG